MALHTKALVLAMALLPMALASALLYLALALYLVALLTSLDLPACSNVTRARCETVGLAVSNVTSMLGLCPISSNVHTPTNPKHTLSVFCYTMQYTVHYTLSNRGVWNRRKMSDIGFLKTEPNRYRNSKTENSVSTIRFSKTDFGSLGTVFHIVSLTIHLAAQQDHQSKYFSSCCVSALLVLSRFSHIRCCKSRIIKCETALANEHLTLATLTFVPCLAVQSQ